MARRKFESIQGSFPCKYCGTVYPWSDLRDACEGKEYFRDKPHEYPILDELDVSVGGKVILTRYVGEDYAPEGYKCGIRLIWKYSKVTEKRVVPGSFSRREGTYLHYAEYRFEQECDSLQIAETLGRRWDVAENRVGAYTPGIPIGPIHVWTESIVRETTSEPWEDYVKNMCTGPDTPETLQKLVEEGFYIYGVNSK